MLREAAFLRGSAGGVKPSWGCRGAGGGSESFHLKAGRLPSPRRGGVGPKGLPETGVGVPPARGKAERSGADGPALGCPWPGSGASPAEARGVGAPSPKGVSRAPAATQKTRSLRGEGGGGVCLSVCLVWVEAGDPRKGRGSFPQSAAEIHSFSSASQFSFCLELFETSNVCLDTDTKQLSSNKNKIACDS